MVFLHTTSSRTLLALKIKTFRSMIAKVGLRINGKLGGAIWSLTMPETEEVMLVGIHVAHDPMRCYPSDVTMVASLNNQMMRYFSTTKVLKRCNKKSPTSGNWE